MLVCTAGLADAQDGRLAASPEMQDRLGNGRAVVVGAFGLDAGGGCVGCHGADGAGDEVAVFPRLAGQSADYLYRSLRAYASGARRNAIMSEVAAALSDQQMRDVALWYATRRDVAASPAGETDPELLQLGAVVAATGSAGSRVQACVNCHGPGGAGLAPAIPYLAGQVRSYVAAQLHAWRDRARGPDELGVMAGIARRLTDDEIAATSAYYAALGAVMTAGAGQPPNGGGSVP